MEIRNYRVFLSSSLKLREEREAFLETFKEASTDEVRFEVYAHERNGVMRIVSGSDSQRAINAAALGCDAFILYAGDRVGTATVDELLHELESAKSLFRFIYVLHQPGYRPDEMEGEGYIDWCEFYREHMHDGRIKYYETQLDALKMPEEDTAGRLAERLANIRAKAAAIAEELRTLAVPILSPAQLDYSKVISEGQREYRKQIDFYFHRKVDDSILEALTTDSPSALTLVSGTSLAGKTRAVTEALKSLPSETHIHILQFNENAGRDLAAINPDLQFAKGFRNVLFVDDLHALFETDQNAPSRFMELCRFAAANPGRLRIIATSILNADATVRPLRALSTGDGWLESCARIEISAMSYSEALQMLRQFRRKGKLEGFAKMKPGVTDIPLGSLFIDFERMRNTYASALDRDYRLSLVFDTVKTLWMWKKKSRSDIGLLLDFINGAYADLLLEPMKPAELIGLLRMIPEFVMLTRGFPPRMVIEEVLVNEVFRFEVCGSVEKGISRIVEYISQRESPLKNFTKLVIRLEKSGLVKQAEEVVDKVCRLFPPESLGKLSETEPTLGERPIDWRDSWRSLVARSLIRRDCRDLLRLLLPDDMAEGDHSYDILLATVIADERKREASSSTLTRLLDADGVPYSRLFPTTSIALITEFILNLPFETGLSLFAETDFRRMALANITGDPDENFEREKTGLFVGMALNALLSRVGTDEEVERALGVLDAQNERLSRTLYGCEAEAFFRLVLSSTWYEVSRSLPEGNVPLLFNRILSVTVPDSHLDNVTLTTSKAVCLNAMIGAMDEYDARTAWLAMGSLRDNFTLTTLLKRFPDFASAKGFVDEYLESESGSDARVNISVLNALLDRCTTRSDVRECRELFIKYRLLPEGGDLMDIRDEYTEGILLKTGRLSFDNKLKLLERHKDISRTRSIRTLGQIVNTAPDYATARSILFDPDVCPVTSEEQELMRSSALVMSWLINKAKTPEEAADARNIIYDLQRRELAGEYLEPMICHPDTNLLSAIIKSRIIFPVTEDAVTFMERIRSLFPESFPINPIPVCNLIERRLEDEAPEPSEATFALLNRLIIKHSRSKTETLRRLVKDRFYGISTVSRNSPFPDRNGIYPMFGADGSLELREAGSLDFAIDMLRHGWLHPFILPDLVRYIAEHDPRPELRLPQIIAYARKWKIYVDHKAYISLRDTLEARGLKTDLLPLARDYSIIKELTLRLHDNQRNSKPISVQRAFAMIREYENRTGCRLYLSQRFMDAIVKGLTKERGARFSDIMDKISDLLPDYFQYNDYVVYFLGHLVRNTEHFTLLRVRMRPGPLNSGCYEALVSAMSKCRVSDRVALAEVIFGELEQSLAASRTPRPSYILAILGYTRRFNLRQALDFLEKWHVDLKGVGYDIHYLMQLVRTVADYHFVLELASKEADPDIMNMSILTGLVYAMYNPESRSVRAEVVDQFNSETMVNRWFEMAGSDKKGTLYSILDKIYKEIDNPDTPEAKDFFDLWEDVGDFRL